MRIGKNPAKEDISLSAKFYHRIIVPVYVPNLDGYFKDAEQILRLCLNSILNTIHEKACLTIVNNGCCEPVRRVLEEYYSNGKVDQLVHFQENKGKIDAIYSVAKGCYEPLITITDSDVLFLSGWITEVENALQIFPEIGLISPCPVPAVWNYINQLTLLNSMIRFELKTGSLISEEDLLKFPASIGKPDFYKGKEVLLQKQLILQRAKGSVTVGCGHFVATIRREVFKHAPDAPSLKKIVGNSERLYIDVPVEKAGFYRVGTSKILAHHMGNSPEQWMIELAQAGVVDNANSLQAVPKARRPLLHFLIPFVIRRYFASVIGVKTFRKLFFKLGGVSLPV